MIVWPKSSTQRRRSPRTSRDVVVSRLPVGSSAKTTFGRRGERAGDRDALLLAAGELGRTMAEALAQADGVDERVEPRRVGVAPGDRERQQDVLLRGEDGQQVEGLEDEPDLVAAQLGQAGVVEPGELGAVERHRAARRLVEAGEQVHERRLPRTRRPHDRGERAGGKPDADPTQRVDPRFAGAVGADEVGRLDEHDRHGDRGRPPWGARPLPRGQSPSGLTGSTTRLNVELVTPANDAYQAATAVARPT